MGKQSSEWWCMRASDALAVRTESYSRESRDKVRNELARSVREGEFPADWPFEQPMKLYEEGLAAVFYFLTIGSLLWVPLVTGILLYMAIFPIFRPVRICLIVAVLMVAMYSPTPPLPGVERSRIAAMMMKYLSLTVVWYVIIILMPSHHPNLLTTCVYIRKPCVVAQQQFRTILL